MGKALRGKPDEWRGGIPAAERKGIRTVERQSGGTVIGLISHASSAGLISVMPSPSMIKMSALPPVPLRPFVERIWSWEGPPETPLPTLLPGTGSDLFFHFAAPFGVEEQGVVSPLNHAHLTCLRSRSARLVSTGALGFVAVRFRTGVLRHFGRMEPLLDRCPDATEVFGMSAADIPARLALLPDFNARVRHVSTFMAGQLARVGATYNRGDMAADMLYNCAELRMAKIAEKSGYTSRSLEREVRNVCGLTPKTFARIIRLHHTVRATLLSGCTSLDAALNCGYYDQAHFAHEFRTLTGMRPRDYFTQASRLSHFYNTKWQA